ncbi:MAG: dethiobiotin synthase [Geminocystis sp.]|nr:dethiobiotin synthase [Geminocystis sp.]HIK37740.1 ATP-dependent dethiobiotin synthetase BioD [Geminocystis sp. M7585_C2015_104]MCS7147279.1 dethiobiotin synthase [Geminocystis sp.]MCX8078495.1 dethiobiotin synthase [Geminocystis sp.]MDW8116278.1 dethiobiotin synthase [Geminocystis sp.]
MKSLLIAGTDTDAGKTIITTALRCYYQQFEPHRATGILKLVQTGEVGDEEFYKQFFPDVVVPLRYAAPLAPPIAAMREGKRVDLSVVEKSFRDLQSRYELLLVEGLGGLGSPVTEQWTVADIASRWGLDTIVVVPIKLGAIAHTVANVALARQCGVSLRGIIFNSTRPCQPEDIQNWTPRQLIESLTSIPVIGYFPFVVDIKPSLLGMLVREHLDLSIIT